MNKFFLLITGIMLCLQTYSQQYVLTMQGERMGTYNSQSECEKAKTEDEFDKQKFVESFNRHGAPIGAKISANDFINICKHCKCVPLSEYEQIQIGKQYSPFVYGRLTELFDNADLKNLAAMVPEINSLRSDFRAMGEYQTPGQPMVSNNTVIDSRANELNDLLEDDFDMGETITNVSSILNNLMENIRDEEMSEEEQKRNKKTVTLSPFSDKTLASKKEALETELQSLETELKKCAMEAAEYNKTAKYNVDKQEIMRRERCQQLKERQQEVQNEVFAINKQEKGREEWIKNVNNMSEETLNAQEKNLRKIATMAGLAEYSYKEKQGLSEDSPWKECKDNVLSNLIDKANNNNVGFHCELLYNEKDKKYVLSFRGTDDIQDKLGAWAQGNFSKDNAQTKIARDITKELLEKGISPKDIELTGHSLGGRLAAEAAIEHNLVAYTFNAANVSLQTRKGTEQNTKGSILNIVSANDPLTASTFGLGSSEGGINYNYSSNFFDYNVIQGVHVNSGNIAKETAGIRTGTYSPGYTNVIKEAYGNGIDNAHGISFLRQALEQRHYDIKSEIEERNKK